MELEDVPVADTWAAMEDLQRAGLARNVGVANFNCQGIRDLFSYAKIKPAVLQVRGGGGGRGEIGHLVCT